MEINQVALYAVVDSLLGQTAAPGAIPDSTREALADTFESALVARQSQLPENKRTGFLDEETLETASTTYLRDIGITHDDPRFGEIIETALAADDHIQGFTLFGGAGSDDEFGLPGDLVGSLGGLIENGDGKSKSGDGSDYSDNASEMKGLYVKSAEKDKDKDKAENNGDGYNKTGAVNNNLGDTSAEPRTGLPDLTKMSGEDAVSFLKEKGLVKFEGKSADKLEALFTKNFNESEFFRQATHYGFTTHGRVMTFVSDPKYAEGGNEIGRVDKGKDGSGQDRIWVHENHLNQRVFAHEFFHSAIATHDCDAEGGYHVVPGTNQIAEAVFAEEAGLDKTKLDLYKNGKLDPEMKLNIDFEKFIVNKDGKDHIYGKDSSEEFDYIKFIKDSRV